MKSKLSKMAIILFVLVSFASTASAYYFDIAATSNGNKNSVDINLVGTPSKNVTGYQFEFIFKGATLSDHTQVTHNTLAPFFSSYGSAIITLSAVVGLADPGETLTNMRLATFIFNGPVSISWNTGYDENYMAFSDYSEVTEATLDLRNSYSSAVPIPGAAWLLGSGILGLMGIRRKRS